MANELGCTLAQLAIAWCAKNPHVSTVITGASRVEQVHENLAALDVVPKLTDDVMARIDRPRRLSRRRASPGRRRGPDSGLSGRGRTPSVADRTVPDAVARMEPWSDWRSQSSRSERGG